MEASLASLPPILLSEVLSWSPDGRSADALLNSCRTSHQLRRDPAAAARLLVRCSSCKNYGAALTASGATCLGGSEAVMRQVLRLLTATAETGGPFTVRAGLLQAMLSHAAVAGDAPTVRTLLALPQPPKANARDGRALRELTQQAPHTPGHLAAMQALLESGADPCGNNLQALLEAAARPDALDALRLLMHHVARPRHAAAANAALFTATVSGNAAAAAQLCPLATHTSNSTNLLVEMAVKGDSLSVLQHLLDLTPVSQDSLDRGLVRAAMHAGFECATLLLDRGGDPNALSGMSLMCAIHFGLDVRAADGADWRPMVRLLVGRGAVMTERVLEETRMTGRAYALQAIVQEAVATTAAAVVVTKS